MAYDAHKNFASSVVATAPSPATSGTSLVVTGGDGTKFPAAPFNAVVCPAGLPPTAANAEVVRVTAISTDTFTITRTQESSSARTVIVGDRVYAGPTARTLTDIENLVPYMDAKGDIIAASAADTPAKVTVGADGTFLQADSAAAGGVSYGPTTMGTLFVAQGFPAGIPSTAATGATNTYYASQVIIPSRATITGVGYSVGTTSNGNVRCALYNLAGTKVADKTSNVAQGTASTTQLVLFDSTYTAVPGVYYALVWFSSATATLVRAVTSGTNWATGTNASTTPTSVTATLSGPSVSIAVLFVF